MKVNNVLQKMREITERRIKLYKTDFYDYDVPWLKRDQPSEFVWMIRDSGTHLMVPCGPDEDKELWRHRYDIFSAANTDFYYCTLNSDGSGTVTKSDKKCAAFAARQSR